jgi:hypothetical protein
MQLRLSVLEVLHILLLHLRHRQHKMVTYVMNWLTPTAAIAKVTNAC